MSRSLDEVVSHTSSDFSHDLPLPSPLHLSPIDLPSSFDLPPSPIDHRKNRFPSTNLEEDFVKINWEAESVQSDSFCTTFYNAIYPEKLVRWFRGVPHWVRILLVSSLFLPPPSHIHHCCSTHHFPFQTTQH
ncbi:hypothetical protein PMAYCL1PPCAC_07041 [Pristionchus mayeri]|uniref:Uncharacterized protein n=1 Tax=Pristionchus mayeri TaxID=1317129 RepID=A0AAN5CCW8_9BILA|nr:hypothetical protein PMAYCL1PPCAC_07041 [Pristionchus mayeri]